MNEWINEYVFVYGFMQSVSINNISKDLAWRKFFKNITWMQTKI